VTPPDDPLDRAVRRHLDREAATVDAAGMLVRVRAARAVPSSRRVWAAGVGGFAAGVAVAASVALVLLFGEGPQPAPLAARETPEEFVRQAREAHAAPTDRCYEVVNEWDPGPLNQAKLVPPVKRSRLWTRGDQFWIETTAPDGQLVAWGQTKDGKVWVAPTRKRGLVYEPTEVGEPIARYCDLMSLRAVSTLGELLERYDLFWREPARAGEPVRIVGLLRPAGPPVARFRQVELELDPATKAIRKAVLKRTLNGEVVGTLTFTLAETADLPEESYDVRGHLDPDAVVLDGKFPPKLPGMPGPPRPDPRAKARDEFLKRMQERGK
jgi:hypothetical protein